MSLVGYIKENCLRGNNRSAVVRKNIVGSLFIRCISIVIQLMLVPLTLGYVSSELYGIWMTLSSMIVWVGFFDIGFTMSLKNKLAAAIALEEWDKGKSLVSTTYFLMLLIFVPMCLIGEIVIPFVDWARFLNVKEIYNVDIQLTLHVLLFFFCLQMVVITITVVVEAFQKVALSTSFGVLANFISLLVIFVLTKTCKPSLVILTFAISATLVLVLFVSSLILYHTQFKAVCPSISKVDTSLIKDLFGLGAKFFVIQMQMLVMYQFTNVLISKVSSPIYVTSYSISYKYISVAMMMFNIVLGPLWPAFTDAYTKNDFGWMKKVYHNVKIVWLLSVSLMVIMVLCSPFAYCLWIGSKAEIPYLMTVSVAIYMMIYTWESLHTYLVNGIGCIKIQTYVTIIGLVFHIPLSLFLANFIGAYGVICSMIVINLLYGIVLTVQTHKVLNHKAYGIWIK